MPSVMHLRLRCKNSNSRLHYLLFRVLFPEAPPELRVEGLQELADVAEVPLQPSHPFGAIHKPAPILDCSLGSFFNSGPSEAGKQCSQGKSFCPWRVF
jgi:hypothetical protein